MSTFSKRLSLHTPYSSLSLIGPCDDTVVVEMALGDAKDLVLDESLFGFGSTPTQSGNFTLGVIRFVGDDSGSVLYNLESELDEQPHNVELRGAIFDCLPLLTSNTVNVVVDSRVYDEMCEMGGWGALALLITQDQAKTLKLLELMEEHIALQSDIVAARWGRPVNQWWVEEEGPHNDPDTMSKVLSLAIALRSGTEDVFLKYVMPNSDSMKSEEVIEQALDIAQWDSHLAEDLLEDFKNHPLADRISGAVENILSARLEVDRFTPRNTRLKMLALHLRKAESLGLLDAWVLDDIELSHRPVWTMLVDGIRLEEIDREKKEALARIAGNNGTSGMSGKPTSFRLINSLEEAKRIRGRCVGYLASRSMMVNAHLDKMYLAYYELDADNRDIDPSIVFELIS